MSEELKDVRGKVTPATHRELYLIMSAYDMEQSECVRAALEMWVAHEIQKAHGALKLLRALRVQGIDGE